MKKFIIVLVALLVVLQAKLWIGGGGIDNLWDLKSRLDSKKEKNYKLATRNQNASNKIKDLKTNDLEVEEQARVSLGMIKKDETYFNIIDKSSQKD